MAEKRIPCTYPMSSRASTVEDCENCEEDDCDIRHCLIQEPLSFPHPCPDE